MASNPFGITQVDIPGLLGMHQKMKRQRMEDLFNARKMDIAEREADLAGRKAQREAAELGALGRLFTSTQPKGGGPASAPVGGEEASPLAAPPSAVRPMDIPPSSPAPQGDLIAPADAAAMRASIGPDRFNAWKQANNVVEEGDVGTAPVAAPVAPLADQPRTIQRPDGLTINMDALREYAQYNPEMAFKLQGFARTADKEQLARVQAHGEIKGLAAKHLMSFPAGPQRQAAFQRIAPDLLARGFSESDLASADLSDQMLQQDIAFGMGLEKLISQENTDRTFAASERTRTAAEARAGEGLAIRRRALDLAERREGRVSAGGGGDIGDTTTSDLLRAAGL